ncbi:MAG: helix-turn-helix transcriptional regulator [Alphaproteobacteria bacterium]|nr:helix-turn-helix transcriptional regulator [Alphaproteobacteria bacterium]
MKNNAARQHEIGHYLTEIRENAGIKQADLARKITWSQAVLSRVEAGERDLSSDELEAVLKAIGTKDALSLSDRLNRTWEILPAPPLNHPDQDILWAAEEVAKELAALRSRPDIKHAFERRLTEYLSEFQNNASLLLKRTHQIAFVGSIGIGKSTAICRLTGLEIASQDGGPSPVLEAGAGGITICEVQLQQGPDYGIRIEPRSDEEIRADIADFAEHIRKGDLDNSSETDGDSQGISKEIERALRNMTGLGVRREKDSDGKTIRRDEARELSQTLNSTRELIVEMLAKMEIHRRDRRDIWYPASADKPPLVWLKETFEQINNGRHPDFTLPKRIDVIVPHELVKGSDLTIHIIDTKGIDRTAARADLEGHFDDSHTLSVLCSGFNNAPAAEARLLLERAKEAGVRGLELNASLLVLPRTNEALAVKDETGIRVETVEEGYELKGEQVEMALEPIGHKFSIGFFNAYEDDPDKLREFLIGRLTQVRHSFRKKMEEITDNAKKLLNNHEQEQTQEVIRQAAKNLQSWIAQNANVPTLNAHIQDSLMNAMSNVYASTLRATIRRDGEWQNLSYSHHLGYGARLMAAASLSRLVENFTSLCKTLTGNSEYADAQDLINQADRVLQTSFDELLRKLQLMGQTSFREALKLDAAFWSGCDNEWGKGPGYKNRVTNRNEIWFKDTARQELESEVRALIKREWSQTLTRVKSLFDTE